MRPLEESMMPNPTNSWSGNCISQNAFPSFTEYSTKKEAAKDKTTSEDGQKQREAGAFGEAIHGFESLHHFSNDAPIDCEFTLSCLPLPVLTGCNQRNER